MRQWIRLDTSTREDRKIARLASALGIPEQHACGLVVWLWAWAAQHAPDGGLDDATDPEIARACGWTADAPSLIGALIGAGLLDGSPGCLAIHGWAERQEPLSEAERKRRSRAAKRATSDALDNASRGVVTPVVTPVTPTVTSSDRQTDRQTDNPTGIENQTKPSGSRSQENQPPSERSDEREITTPKQLEAWGYSKFGSLTGSSWAKLKTMLPAHRDELDAAAAAGGHSWGYLAKVLTSMREKASQQAPQAPQRKAPRPQHPAIERALAHHAAGKCGLPPDVDDQREIVRRAEADGGIDWALLERANSEPDCDSGFWETLWRVYDRLKNAPVAHGKGPRIDAEPKQGPRTANEARASHSDEIEGGANVGH